MVNLEIFATWVLPAVLVGSAWLMFAQQLVHTLRVGVAGVSAEAWAAMLTSRVVIAIYGWVVLDPIQVVAAAFPAVCSVVIVAAALRAASSVERAQVGLWAVVATGVGVASAVAGSTVAAVALVAMAGLSSVPQLVSVCRRPDISGVSVRAWVLSAGCSLAWMVHGFVTGLVPVVVANVVWLSTSVAIAAVTAHRSQTSTLEPVAVAAV